MNRYLLVRIGLISALGVSAAQADHVIAWRPIPGATSQPSEQDRQRASTLARESIDLLEHKEIPGAEAKLREALAMVPDKAVWHYNLACILTFRGQTESAMDSLSRACELGFTDFTLIEGDSDLKPLRSLPRYQQLIARKDEIRHGAALRAMNDLEGRFGKDYLYEVDEEQKLIFATNTDRQTLDALKLWLHNQAKSQGELLFAHKPDEFVRVVVPSLADYRKLVHQPGVMGVYEDETRTLLAQRLGQVMTHEFTHAMHAADQRAVGQEHPVWIREGLASMYEAADFEDGKLIPHDNFRLGFVQSAARRNALIPLNKVLNLKIQDFVNAPNLAYGESSSLMLYLYEQNLLRTFYDVYKATYGADPTGAVALESVTGMKLPELQQAWTQWMLVRKSPQLALTPGGPYLGVHFGAAVDGLKVALVLPASAASKAGLRAGDVIVGLDEHEVRDYTSFSPMLSAHKAGDEIKLKVRRDGKYLDVPVVLGQR